MPVLDITAAELAHPSRMTLNRIECMMLWPGDPEKWEPAIRAAEAVLLRERAQSANEGQISTAEWKTIVGLVADAPRLREVQEGVKTPFKRGVMAGMLVRQAVGWKQVNPVKAGAQAIKKEIAATFNVSVSLIDNTIWPEYKPVAHFWAAVIELAFKNTNNPFPCRLNQAQEMLALAKAFLRLGSAAPQRQSDKRLLDEATAWTLPPDVPVPEIDLRYERPSKRSMTG